MNSDDLKKLKVAKFKCLTSTLFFTRYFFKKRFNRKFVVGEHHELISSALDRVIKGETKKLLINIAPRYGKTELAVKNFIAHGLAINPAARFIHLSYSDDLALDNSEEVRDIVSSEEYQQLFGVQIKKNSDAKKKWYTTEGGGVYATSAAGQVTGFGAGKVDDEDFEFPESKNELFGGALIIDDPIKPDDADSELIRERVNQRFDSTLRNRVNSRNTPIIIIMQRLHENDLCGYLMEQEPEDWEVLSLPSIKTDGSALWPFKHTIEELLKIEKQNDVVFQRQHMQDPKPLKGLLFPPNELTYYRPDELLKFESSIGYADIADQGDDDLCALIGKTINDKCYITKVVFNKENSEITIPMVATMINESDCRYFRCESNSMGGMYAKTLEKEVNVCQVLTATSTTNKHTRILMDAPFIKRNFIFLHSDYWDDEYRNFIKQLTGYLKAGQSNKDDAPDACSGLAIFIRSMLPSFY